MKMKLIDAMHFVNNYNFDIYDIESDFSMAFWFNFDTADKVKEQYFHKVMGFLANEIEITGYRHNGYSPCLVSQFIVKYKSALLAFGKQVYENFVFEEEFDYLKLLKCITLGDFYEEEYKELYELLKRIKWFLEKIGNDPYLVEAYNRRNNKLVWYVLHYHTLTTEYLNEIEFKTFEEAYMEYLNAEPYNVYDRVELIFSPELEDEFNDNRIVFFKEVK